MRFIKKIAFGTMTSALCLFSGFAAKADRVQLSVSPGVSAIGNNNSIFGKPKYDKNKTNAELGVMETYGIYIDGGVKYDYSFNEYFDLGIEFGASFFSNSADVQKGTTGKSTETAKATISLIKPFIGLDLLVSPLGDPSLLLGLTAGPEFGIGALSMCSNKALEDDKTDHLKADNIKTRTGDRINTLGFFGKLYLQYDFRDLMDFPLILGIQGKFVFHDLFDTEEAKGKDDKAVTAKDQKYILGNKVVKDTKSPNIFFSIAATLGVDLGYYFF